MRTVNNCGMKRFLLTTVLIATLIGVMLYFVPRPMQSDVLSYAEYDPAVVVYCRKTSRNAVNTGLGYQVGCSVTDFSDTLADCGDVDGVSVTFAGSFDDVERELNRLRAQNVSVQQLDGLYVACFYSPLIRERAVIDGKLVNVQIAYRDGTVTVGYPLILGAY